MYFHPSLLRTENDDTWHIIISPQYIEIFSAKQHFVRLLFSTGATHAMQKLSGKELLLFIKGGIKARKVIWYLRKVIMYIEWSHCNVLRSIFWHITKIVIALHGFIHNIKKWKNYILVLNCPITSWSRVTSSRNDGFLQSLFQQHTISLNLAMKNKRVASITEVVSATSTYMFSGHMVGIFSLRPWNNRSSISWFFTPE